MPEPIDIECPSCDQRLVAADESGLVKAIQEHLYEDRALVGGLLIAGPGVELLSGRLR